MRISTDTRASRDENVDYAAFLSLSSSSSVFVLFSRILSSFVAALRLSLPSSILGPLPNPFLPLLLLLILVRVSSRFTTEVDPGRGGLYLLRLALQIGRSKKISLKKCQYIRIYRVYVLWVHIRPPLSLVIKSSGFLIFRRVYTRTRFFLFLFPFSSLYFLSLAVLTPSLGLSFFFLFPDSRLNGSRSLSLSLFCSVAGYTLLFRGMLNSCSRARDRDPESNLLFIRRS